MTSITRREFVKASAAMPLALSTFTKAARTATPAERFDVVVAGAGHNSLLCAAYLAKAGFTKVDGAWKVKRLLAAGSKPRKSAIRVLKTISFPVRTSAFHRITW